MGFFVALGVVSLLAVIPLGVNVSYDSHGPLVRVIAGPVRITVFPLPKREKKKKTPKLQNSVTVPTEPVPQNPPAPPKPKEEKPESQKGGSILDFWPLVQLLFRFLGDFRRKLRVNCLHMKLILAGGDPASLAINYGRTWAAVGNLMPQLERLFVIKKRDIEVECDFTGSETLVIAGLDLTITLGRLLSLAFVYAIRALIEFINIKKKRKGGAENE